MLLCESSCASVSDLKFNFFDGKIFFPAFAELLFLQDLLERSLQDAWYAVKKLWKLDQIVKPMLDINRLLLECKKWS